LPKVLVSAEGAARIANGNPGAVTATEAEFGDLAWASYQGQPIAVGVYKAGALHPSRVFRL
jgi:tRNA pseudouridine55 synthase